MSEDRIPSESSPNNKRPDSARLPPDWLLPIRYVPVLVFLLGLGITALLWLQEQDNVREHLAVEFNVQADKFTDAISNRLKANEQVLRGVVGLFDASESVSRREFRSYVDSLRLDEQFPGILGVGFSKLIPADTLKSHLSEIRREGFPGYRIYPEGQRDPYSSIILLEPFAGRNLRAFGYDMYSEPVRRTAMERARNLGVSALSGKVILVQETETDVQNGFLMYLPIYRHDLPHSTPEERRAALIGWAYSPLRIRDMLNGVLSSVAFSGLTTIMQVSIHDGATVAPDALMFDSHPSFHANDAAPAFQTLRRLGYAGSAWTLTFASLPAFDARANNEAAKTTAAAGLAISALLSALLAVIANSQRRIVQSLRETAAANQALAASESALRESETKYRFVTENAVEWVFWVDTNGHFVYNSPSCLHLTGYGPEAFVADPSLLDRLIHPDDRELFRHHRTPVATGQDIEFRLLHRDGTTRWISQVAKPISDLNGKPLGYRASNRDVTDRKQAIESLRVSEARFRSLAGASPVGIFLADSDGTCTYVNPRWMEITGGESGPPPWNNLFSAIHPADRGLVESAWKRAVDERVEFAIECRVRHADGTLRYIHARARAIIESDASVCEYVGTVEDVTERRQAEARLKLASSVFTHAQEGIMITDPTGRILDVNGTFTKITGYERHEVLGLNAGILSSGRQPIEFYEAMWRDLINKDHWYGEIWNRRKSGEFYIESLKISAVRDGDGNLQQYVALFSDITAMKEHQDQLERIAHYDALTGLANRVLLADRLQHALAQARRRKNLLALVYLDLDGFKAVNDEHGHEVGDELLIAVSQRLADTLREGDTLARLGGDEFIAVLVDLTSTTECEWILSRLLRAAAVPIEIDGKTMQVSASIGVTLYPNDRGDADTLLRHADQAMYQAKQSGKNRFHVFDPSADQLAQKRWESRQQIQAALQRGEFELFYQPRVNLQSGQVAGVEALIRWNHPDRGLLGPDDFLAEIDHTELVARFGDWTLDRSIEQIRQWHSKRLDLNVSVNIAAHHLLDPSFVANLRTKIFTNPAVPPELLELELIESAALGDIARISKAIADCRELGVLFSLDDFGTGYSSLSHLRRLPATGLKIDRSFIHEMLRDTDDLTLVEGIIRLACAFRRRVTAEGVETIDHASALARLGCELAQGFFIARPMPAAQIPGWVDAWQATAHRFMAARRDEESSALLHCEVAHREWLHRLEQWLEDASEGDGLTLALPSCFDTLQCAEMTSMQTDSALLREANASHHVFSDSAQRLLACLRAGRTLEARAEFDRLRRETERFTSLLRKFSETDRTEPTK